MDKIRNIWQSGHQGWVKILVLLLAASVCRLYESLFYQTAGMCSVWSLIIAQFLLAQPAPGWGISWSVISQSRTRTASLYSSSHIPRTNWTHTIQSSMTNCNLHPLLSSLNSLKFTHSFQLSHHNKQNMTFGRVSVNASTDLVDPYSKY